LKLQSEQTKFLRQLLDLDFVFETETNKKCLQSAYTKMECMVGIFLGQASFYLLEPAVNTVLCRLCYKQKKVKGLQNGTNWRENKQINQICVTPKKQNIVGQR